MFIPTRVSVNGHIFLNYLTCFSYLLSVFIKSLSLAPRFSCLQSMCSIGTQGLGASEKKKNNKNTI